MQDAKGKPTEESPLSVPHPFSRPYDADAIEARLRALREREAFLLDPAIVPKHFAHSSVLICFWRERTDLRLLLTRRADTLRGHPGQMAFPGGRLEAGEDWQDAALRETHEEVGLAPEKIEILGRLDDAWSGAGHRLVPFVGWLASAPICTPNPDEVSEIHTPRLEDLFAPDAFSFKAGDLDGEPYIDPAFSWNGGEVYGLSASLLVEAVQWGLGIAADHGASRQRHLVAYLRQKAKEPTKKAELGSSA